jgi:hypothetical protein
MCDARESSGYNGELMSLNLETKSCDGNRIRMIRKCLHWSSFMAIVATLSAAILAVPARAGENLRLNPHLDYSSDSNDGPLITGDRMNETVAAGKPNHIIFYGEACYNSKRQARRTVSLYEKYRGRVNFVIIDLDQKHTPQQEELISSHYRGSIPHVTIIDRDGKTLYDRAGEVNESDIANLLDPQLK